MDTLEAIAGNTGGSVSDISYIINSGSNGVYGKGKYPAESTKLAESAYKNLTTSLENLAKSKYETYENGGSQYESTQKWISELRKFNTETEKLKEAGYSISEQQGKELRALVDNEYLSASLNDATNSYRFVLNFLKHWALFYVGALEQADAMAAADTVDVKVYGKAAGAGNNSEIDGKIENAEYGSEADSEAGNGSEAGKSNFELLVESAAAPQNYSSNEKAGKEEIIKEKLRSSVAKKTTVKRPTIKKSIVKEPTAEKSRQGAQGSYAANYSSSDSMQSDEDSAEGTAWYESSAKELPAKKKKTGLLRNLFYSSVLATGILLSNLPGATYALKSGDYMLGGQPKKSAASSHDEHNKNSLDSRYFFSSESDIDTSDINNNPAQNDLKLHGKKTKTDENSNLKFNLESTLEYTQKANTPEEALAAMSSVVLNAASTAASTPMSNTSFALSAGQENATATLFLDEPQPSPLEAISEAKSELPAEAKNPKYVLEPNNQSANQRDSQSDNQDNEKQKRLNFGFSAGINSYGNTNMGLRVSKGKNSIEETFGAEGYTATRISNGQYAVGKDSDNNLLISDNKRGLDVVIRDNKDGDISVYKRVGGFGSIGATTNGTGYFKVLSGTAKISYRHSDFDLSILPNAVLMRALGISVDPGFINIMLKGDMPKLKNIVSIGLQKHEDINDKYNKLIRQRYSEGNYLAQARYEWDKILFNTYNPGDLTSLVRNTPVVRHLFNSQLKNKRIRHAASKVNDVIERVMSGAGTYHDFAFLAVVQQDSDPLAKDIAKKVRRELDTTMDVLLAYGFLAPKENKLLILKNQQNQSQSTPQSSGLETEIQQSELQKTQQGLVACKSEYKFIGEKLKKVRQENK